MLGEIAGLMTNEATRLLGVEKVFARTPIAAREGIRQVQKHHPALPVFTAAIDRQLNKVGFILPGLGDAGDRLFGT